MEKTEGPFERYQEGYPKEGHPKGFEYHSNSVGQIGENRLKGTNSRGYPFCIPINAGGGPGLLDKKGVREKRREGSGCAVDSVALIGNTPKCAKKCAKLLTANDKESAHAAIHELKLPPESRWKNTGNPRSRETAATAASARMSLCMSDGEKCDPRLARDREGAKYEGRTEEESERVEQKTKKPKRSEEVVQCRARLGNPVEAWHVGNLERQAKLCSALASKQGSAAGSKHEVMPAFFVCGQDADGTGLEPGVERQHLNEDYREKQQPYESDSEMEKRQSAAAAREGLGQGTDNNKNTSDEACGRGKGGAGVDGQEEVNIEKLFRVGEVCWAKWPEPSNDGNTYFEARNRSMSARSFSSLPSSSLSPLSLALPLPCSPSLPLPPSLPPPPPSLNLFLTHLILQVDGITTKPLLSQSIRGLKRQERGTGREV